MTSPEVPAAERLKAPTSSWKQRTATMLGLAVFWIMMAMVLMLATSKPLQGLHITNTGSRSVYIQNVSKSWWDETGLTLHPGMTGWWKFRDTDQFRITVSEEEPPPPGTTPPASGITSRSEAWGTPLIPDADGSGTIVMRHASRTAEVRVNDEGQIEFEFTDL